MGLWNLWFSMMVLVSVGVAWSFDVLDYKSVAGKAVGE